jgi:hypothetical protein
MAQAATTQSIDINYFRRAIFLKRWNLTKDMNLDGLIKSMNDAPKSGAENFIYYPNYTSADCTPTSKVSSCIEAGIPFELKKVGVDSTGNLLVITKDGKQYPSYKIMGYSLLEEITIGDKRYNLGYKYGCDDIEIIIEKISSEWDGINNPRVRVEGSSTSKVDQTGKVFKEVPYYKIDVGTCTKASYGKKTVSVKVKESQKIVDKANNEIKSGSIIRETKKSYNEYNEYYEYYEYYKVLEIDYINKDKYNLNKYEILDDSLMTKKLVKTQKTINKNIELITVINDIKYLNKEAKIGEIIHTIIGNYKIGQDMYFILKYNEQVIHVKISDFGDNIDSYIDAAVQDRRNAVEEAKRAKAEERLRPLTSLQNQPEANINDEAARSLQAARSTSVGRNAAKEKAQREAQREATLDKLIAKNIEKPANIQLGDIQSIKSINISILTPDDILVLDKDDIEQLTKEQLQALSKKQLQALSEDQLQALSEEQLSYLSLKQLESLTDTQKEYFTAKQIDYIDSRYEEGQDTWKKRIDRRKEAKVRPVSVQQPQESQVQPQSAAVPSMAELGSSAVPQSEVKTKPEPEAKGLLPAGAEEAQKDQEVPLNALREAQEAQEAQPVSAIPSLAKAGLQSSSSEDPNSSSSKIASNEQELRDKYINNPNNYKYIYIQGSDNIYKIINRDDNTLTLSDKNGNITDIPINSWDVTRVPTKEQIEQGGFMYGTGRSKKLHLKSKPYTHSDRRNRTRRMHRL